MNIYQQQASGAVHFDFSSTFAKIIVFTFVLNYYSFTISDNK